MKVSDCMSRNVSVISPNDSILTAAKAMKQIDAGFLPVGEQGRLVGMITDRDIAIRAVAEGRNPHTAVRDIMSSEVLYCFDDEEIAAVAENMADNKVRRLPVISRDKRLIGVISLGDLSHSDGGGRHAGTALGSISEPGGKHAQQ